MTVEVHDVSMASMCEWCQIVMKKGAAGEDREDPGRRKT
jgi:hypothetical protein